MKLDEWLHVAETDLSNAGVDSARLDAQVLASFALGRSRSWVLAHGDAPAPIDRLSPLLDRRINREPLAYIVGSREFYGREFRVGPGALIPRQETEGLVQASLDHTQPGDRVLELGVGSGCVSITLALEAPKLAVYGCDVSLEALRWADENNRRHNAHVRLALCDLLSGFRPDAFDVMISNPPYIDSPKGLEPEVVNFEPSRALFASGHGLYFYRSLAKTAQSCRKLIVEVGDGMDESVAATFERRGWHVAERRTDLLGHVRNLVLCPPLG